MLSLILLTIIPFLVLDVYAEEEPPSDQQPDQPSLPFTVVPYQEYNKKISSTGIITYDEMPDRFYKKGPKCDPHVYVFSRSVEMTTEGDITLTFSTKQDFTGGKVYLSIHTTVADESISLATESSTRGAFTDYTVTVPKYVFGNVGDNSHVSIKGFFFLSRDTIHNTGAFSFNESGSPLYYQNSYASSQSITDNIAIQLPDASDSTTFSSITDSTGKTVYVPQGNALSLSDPIVCKFGNIAPQVFAKIFRMNMAASDGNNGLKFTYNFDDRTFSNGAIEQRPSTIYWIATDSDGDSVAGNTDKKIKKTFDFTIPLDSGTYDIVMYGKGERGKLLGVYSNSHTYPVPDTASEQIMDLESKLEQQETTYDELWIEYERSATMYYKLLDEHDTTKKALAMCKDDLSEAQSTIEQLKQEKAKLQADFNTSEGSYNTLEKLYNEALEEIKRLKSSSNEN